MTNKKNSVIFQAIELATKAHSGQFRKCTNIPYIAHPLGACKILTDYKYPEEIIIAGILHDVLEDGFEHVDPPIKNRREYATQKIRKEFGGEILSLVEGASEPEKAETWDERDKSSWRQRKQHTIDHLKEASHNILIVSCADKLDNIRAIKSDLKRIGDDLWKRFNANEEDIKWYYKSLSKVFSSRQECGDTIPLFQEFINTTVDVFGHNDLEVRTKA